MFFCQLTKQTSKSGETLHKVTVVKREKIYYRWVENEKTEEWEEIEIARGTEIVKEIPVCEDGLREWNDMLASGEITWDETIVEALDGKEKHFTARW